METGESVNVSVTFDEKQKEKKKDEKKKSVEIRYSVFFDGTLNNRTNTDLRIKATKKDVSSVEDKKANEIYDKYKTGDSYKNDYSNVAKLERYITKKSEEKKLIHASYIEGPGSDDEEKDKKIGYMFGLGPSGVRKKVAKGINDVVSTIKKKVKKNIIIELLVIDVFGFSRGAAGARNFIYEALIGDEVSSIKQQLEDGGYEIEKIEVCFAGLFDTVSSHGVFYFNDVCDLKLDAIRHAKNVVHLASSDEHRERFSLTNIKSAGFKGREIFLPGVHSDIGGSYNNEEEEKKAIFDSWKYNVEEDSEKLIESGWFKKDEVLIESYTDFSDDDADAYAISSIKRDSVSNHYSRIPLQIMSRFAKENKIEFDDNLESKEGIIGDTLIQINKRIKQYISDTDPKNKASNKIFKVSKMEDWHSIDDVLLHALRNKYLHFSAQWSIGLKPRMSFWTNKRLRKTYNG